MVRRRASAVSNHEAPIASFETPRFARLPEDEDGEWGGVSCCRCPLVIARSEATKRSIFPPSREMDCFASLAMTGAMAHPFTILRQCSHAASIRFSLASGVRNAECADSVTFGSLVRG